MQRRSWTENPLSVRESGREGTLAETVKADIFARLRVARLMHVSSSLFAELE